ncbi:MAG: hypothetical protein ACE5KP_02860 [Dehalococcoidales bacterium]
MFAVKEDNDISRGTWWLLLVGIFLISFSLLAFEITLTRLLSVLLLYHFVFAVVSLALLGLGVGGIFVYFFRPQIPSGDNRFSSLALFASLISLAIPLSVILMVQIGYIDAIRDNILVYCFLLFIPFFFTGVLLAEVFRMFPMISARIYGADLVGAAIGSLGVILVLNVLGGINTSFLLGIVASVAALLFALKILRENIRRVIMATASFLIVSILLGANLVGAYLPNIAVIGANPVKDIHRALYGPSFTGKIIETRWSAFGRTDLVEFSDRPELMEIYIDGTAGMPMFQFSGDFDRPSIVLDSLKNDFTGYFPFFFLPEGERNNALIIGPGGGRDILLALMGEVGQITAVEVNKDLVDIVKEYAWYNGGIYTDFENVTVVVDEGRNFLKRQKEKYDIIMLSLPVTQTSRSLEGYALTENFLFTTDSINDYLEHLTDEGRLVVVTHDDVTMWRLISISLATLSERGVSNTAALNQIYMLGLGSADIYPVFVLKKTPFALSEVLLRHEKMRQLGYDPILSYFPYIGEVGMVNPVLKDLSSGKLTLNDAERVMAKEMGIDISPVTDNSPFFYKIDVGLPQPVSLVFWLSIIMMLLVLLVPPLYWKWRPARKETHSGSKKSSNQNPLKSVVLFSMLGIGFMLVEISLIQRFMLFLGRPVLSMAVLLFSLLVGAGLGSLYSGRFASERITKGITIASMSIAAVVVSYTFLLPLIFDQLLGLALAIRLLAMVIVLIPLGFLMGFPFPLGIRLLKEMRIGKYIPWMWGINGVGSVLGSVMTIAVAISFGFTQALLAGAVCYFIVFLTFRKHRLSGNLALREKY